MRAWIAKLIVEIARGVWEVIREDVRFCDHGYIEVTCAQCSERWKP